MGLAVVLKDFSNRPAFTALDFLVKIDEYPTELVRERPADCRLSSAHEADQVNAGVLHEAK